MYICCYIGIRRTLRCINFVERKHILVIIYNPTQERNTRMDPSLSWCRREGNADHCVASYSWPYGVLGLLIVPVSTNYLLIGFLSLQWLLQWRLQVHAVIRGMLLGFLWLVGMPVFTVAIVMVRTTQVL